MGVDMMHTTNQRIILRRIQERKSFRMNQATPHLGAELSLINSESNNCRGQPRMGTALTSEWWLSHEWANAWKEQRRLWNANKGTLGRWIIKEGGDLYFKSGKDTCISIIMHCFYHCQIGDTYHFSGSVFSNPTSFWVRLWALTSQVVCFLTLPHSECAFEPPSLR